MEERALIYSVYSEHKFYGTIGLMVTHAFNIDFRTENLQEAFRNYSLSTKVYECTLLRKKNQSLTYQ